LELVLAEVLLSMENYIMERVMLDNVSLKGIVNVFSSVVLDEDNVIEGIE
jgi:hypothetical protein